jgi:hypothetical protein
MPTFSTTACVELSDAFSKSNSLTPSGEDLNGHAARVGISKKLTTEEENEGSSSATFLIFTMFLSLSMLHNIMWNVSSTLQISSLPSMNFVTATTTLTASLAPSIREFIFYRTQLTGMANELGMLHLSPEAPRECIKLQYPFNQIVASLAKTSRPTSCIPVKRRPMPSSVLFPTNLN